MALHVGPASMGGCRALLGLKPRGWAGLELASFFVAAGSSGAGAGLGSFRTGSGAGAADGSGTVEVRPDWSLRSSARARVQSRLAGWARRGGLWGGLGRG